MIFSVPRVSEGLHLVLLVQWERNLLIKTWFLSCFLWYEFVQVSKKKVWELPLTPSSSQSSTLSHLCIWQRSLLPKWEEWPEGDRIGYTSGDQLESCNTSGDNDELNWGVLEGTERCEKKIWKGGIYETCKVNMWDKEGVTEDSSLIFGLKTS